MKKTITSKKIKLLLPFLSVATITTITTSLSSCNKDVFGDLIEFSKIEDDPETKLFLFKSDKILFEKGKLYSIDIDLNQVQEATTINCLSLSYILHHSSLLNLQNESTIKFTKVNIAGKNIKEGPLETIQTNGGWIYIDDPGELLIYPKKGQPWANNGKVRINFTPLIQFDDEVQLTLSNDP